jgi:hypothetical protein
MCFHRYLPVNNFVLYKKSNTMKLKMFTLAVVVITIASCKKDPISNPPVTQPGNKLIVLLSDYVSVDKIDSAIVNWDLNGPAHRLKLQPGTYDLSASTATLQAGNGRLTIQIFSKNKLGGKSLQYERVVNLGLQQNTTVTVTGPNLFEDANWNPRVIFDHRGHYLMKVTAVIGIRPTDPYFELININEPWNSRVIVQREYYHTSDPATAVATGTWDCQNNCTDAFGNYKNTTFFSFLPQLINNAPWNRIQFTLRFYNTPVSAGELNFDHNF